MENAYVEPGTMEGAGMGTAKDARPLRGAGKELEGRRALGKEELSGR